VLKCSFSGFKRNLLFGSSPTGLNADFLSVSFVVNRIYFIFQFIDVNRAQLPFQCIFKGNPYDIE